MVNGHLRTVCIKYLQPVAFLRKLFTCILKSRCRLFGQKRQRLLISVNSGTHKIACAVVTDIQNHIGDHITQRDEIG